MVKFEEKKGKLFIDGKEVIKGFESFNGWYWFALEVVGKQDSDLGDGKVFKNDVIYYGLVQGFEEEYGNFALSDIKSLGSKAWEIPKKNLPFSGRRG